MKESTGENESDLEVLYQKVRWGSVNYGGGESRTHSFKKVSDTRFEFRTHWIYVIIIRLGGAAGLALILKNLYTAISTGKYTLESYVFFGILLLVFALFFYSKMGKTAIFDLSQGYYWKGNPKYIHNLERNYEPSDLTLLADIMALQILSEKVEDASDSNARRSYFTSYELNIVLHSGGRINVLDHAGFYSMKQGAETICRAMNIPLLIQKEILHRH